MRRVLSVALILSLLLGVMPVPGHAGERHAVPRGRASTAPQVEKKRDTNKILLWGGLFLANSALLTLGLMDRDHYKDAADDAEALGEDPGPYEDSYDRASWVVAASGAALVVSTVGLLSALRARPVTATVDKTRLAAGREDDPVGRAIGEIEARQSKEERSGKLGGSSAKAEPPSEDARSASRDRTTPSSAGARPKPVIISSVKKQQAWYPGTVQVGADSSDARSSDGAEETPSRVGVVTSEEVAGGPASPPPSRRDSSQESVEGESAEGQEQPKTRFAVQVASYRKEDDARGDAARWAARGYPAEVVAKDLGTRGVWYRVILGDFGPSAEAERLADWLRGTFPKQDAFVVRRARPDAGAPASVSNR